MRSFSCFSRLRLLTVFTGLLLMGGAFDSQAKAGKNKLVAFIPDTDWPPYLIEQEHGAAGGLLPELLRAVLEPLGYEVDLLRLPNKRGWVMLDSGEVDLHLKAREWVPNADDYDWTDPMFDSEDVLLSSKERPIRFEEFADLKGLRIAVIRSFVYPGLDEMFAAGEATRVPVDSPFAMLDLVAMDRVDAAVVNRAETLWLFRNRPELHGERFALTRRATDVSPYRFVFTRKKDWSALIHRINQELAEMKTDGRLDAILSKYR